MPVGVADRDVVRRSSLYRSYTGRIRADENPWIVVSDRRLDEPAVGQRQEVEAVVDEIELVGALEHVRRCAGTRQTFGVERRDPPSTRAATTDARWRYVTSRRWRRA